MENLADIVRREQPLAEKLVAATRAHEQRAAVRAREVIALATAASPSPRKPTAALAARRAQATTIGPKPIRATPFILRDPKLIPQREFLFGRHYVRRYMSATFGAGGGGKSAHAVTEALAMTTGRYLLGEPPKQPLRVWYANAEDPMEEIERRFAAAAIHYNITADQLGDRLFTDSGREQSFVVVREDRRETRILEPVVDSIIAEIKAREIDVLIVDPFVSTHEVDENDNSRIQRVAEQWVRVAQEANCAVELIHHVRKTTGTGEITADDGRGAGALKDKARSVRVVNGMSKDEAASLGVPEHDADLYFRVSFGKANMARRGGRASWRKFMPVWLGNGGGNLNAGDEIGVVTEWHPPTAGDLANEVPADALAAIKARIAGGDYRENAQARDWAGHVVAEVLSIDTSEKPERKRIERLLRAWIAAGELAVETRIDPVRRVNKTFVVVPHHPEN